MAIVVFCLLLKLKTVKQTPSGQKNFQVAESRKIEEDERSL